VSRIKHQVVRVTIPNATAANTLNRTEARLDSLFKKCTGYIVYDVTNIGDQKYSIALTNSSGLFQDNVISEHLKIDKSVAPDLRFHKCDFKAVDEKVTIDVINLALTTSEINIDFIFKLEN
jgi:hypothetical protein